LTVDRSRAPLMTRDHPSGLRRF